MKWKDVYQFWFSHEGIAATFMQNLYAAPFFIAIWVSGGFILGMMVMASFTPTDDFECTTLENKDVCIRYHKGVRK